MFPVVGKRGKKRNCQWKEPIANERRDSVTTPFIWRNDARRHLVVATAARLSWIIGLYRLFHLGGVSGQELLCWQLHLAILFARTFRRFATQLVWTETWLVAVLAHLLSRAVSSLGTRRISPDVLLLSRRILQGVLGRSASVHSGRTSQKLLGRAVVPADHAERAPLFSLSGAFFSDRAVDRRLERAVVSRWIWNWSGHDRARNKRCFARRLHVWLSLAKTSCRRFIGSIFEIANMLSRLHVRDLFQSPPHALGEAEFVLGRFRRSLRAPLCNGDLARCSTR